MPLRHRTTVPPGRPASTLLSIPTPCRYCTAGRRAGAKHNTLRNRLRRLLKQGRVRSLPPSVCHACGMSGRMAIEFKQVDWSGSRSSSSAAADKQPVGPMNESCEDDATSDQVVNLYGASRFHSRRPAIKDSQFVETWVEQQRAIVATMQRRWRSRERWQRWSRHNLIKKKPGSRRPPPGWFVSSAPRGLKTIPEEDELVEGTRRICIE